MWIRTPRPLLVATLWVVTACLWVGCDSTDSEDPGPPEVVVADVTTKNVPMFADWIGSAEGFNNATIRPQVKGYLLEINYRQGTFVNQGELLFKIDPREFKAELASSQGQLGEAKANLRKTRSHVDRYRPLASQGAISQQELDDAIQNMLAAEAGVVTAKARVQQAKLNLSWTNIDSPISGIAGISVTQIGDLVSPTTELTTVSQLDPIKVNFPISEQAYLEVVNSSSAFSDKGTLSDVGPILQLYLADGSIWPHRGTPFIVGRNVNESTGTIVVEGRFPNPQSVIRPGQFARVRVDVGTRKDALLIPQRAVTDVQGKYLVSVVTPKNEVEVRPVEVGDTYEKDWIVTKGLKAGERVIVEGLQKARTGMKVKPVNEKTFMKQDKAASLGEEETPSMTKVGRSVHSAASNSSTS
ncbi:MAG: efflux RND transporter periplasmic adaptor subunit [Myxococcota bacterium]|nr:efflux RND transporter periplasmic adaptor subunit [Myxococcota bacterium]